MKRGKSCPQVGDDVERLVKDNPNIKVEEIYNELIADNEPIC